MTSSSALPPVAGITPVAPLRAPSAVAQGTTDAGAQILQSLQSLDDLVPAGTTLDAEVLATRLAGQRVQFLLQLHLAEGGSLLLTTQGTGDALPVGAKLVVSVLGTTQLAVLLKSLSEGSPASPPQPPPLQQLDLRQLPVGTALQLRVLSNLPDPEAPEPGYQVVAKALDSSLEGRQLQLASARPLPVGSLLTVVVKDSQALSVLPLAQRLDQLDIDHQLQAQSQRQTSLNTLLQWVQDTPTGSLPAAASSALADLLANIADTPALLTPLGWAQALARSGLQLEQLLLDPHGHDALRGDFKAQLLRLVDSLLEWAPPDPARNAQLASQLANANLSENLRKLLNQAAGSTRAPNTLDFPLADREGRGLASSELEALLELATGVIARLQTHQLASLAQTQVLPDGYYLSTWQTEIPWNTGARLSAVQVRFQEERPPPEPSGEQPASLWKVELAFDLDPLGPLQVRAQLARGSLSSEFWAERPAIAALIDGELHHLRERLVGAGFAVGELLARQGRPARDARTTLQHRWIDDTV